MEVRGAQLLHSLRDQTPPLCDPWPINFLGGMSSDNLAKNYTPKRMLKKGSGGIVEAELEKSLPY